VVTYTSAHCIAALVPLLQQCPHVVFSDNGSHDDTLHTVKALLPHAAVLAHGRNLGFGTANNRALATVNTSLALLLNPDCLIQPEALVELVHESRQYPEAAILAPQLLKANGQPDVNYRWPHVLWRSKGPQADGPACVGFVCGAAMLFRIQAFSKTGFFDEDFFLYYEDDDLCQRLFKQQLAMVVLPHVVATHFNRGSVKGKHPWRSEYIRGYHHAQSKLFFTGKHIGLREAKMLRYELLLLTMIALPARIIFFSPKLIARMWGRLIGLRSFIFRLV
jgi:GT2 family glycosyltransferase